VNEAVSLILFHFKHVFLNAWRKLLRLFGQLVLGLFQHIPHPLVLLRRSHYDVFKENSFWYSSWFVFAWAARYQLSVTEEFLIWLYVGC
jgi:hypothetical protein